MIHEILEIKIQMGYTAKFYDSLQKLSTTDIH